jgi:hypothetical protein
LVIHPPRMDSWRLGIPPGLAGQVGRRRINRQRP